MPIDHNEQLAHIERQLASVVAKLDMFIANSTDHESRIRGLERNLWLAFGGGAVLMVIGSTIKDYLVKHL